MSKHLFTDAVFTAKSVLRWNEHEDGSAALSYYVARFEQSATDALKDWQEIREKWPKSAGVVSGLGTHNRSAAEILGWFVNELYLATSSLRMLAMERPDLTPAELHCELLTSLSEWYSLPVDGKQIAGELGRVSLMVEVEAEQETLDIIKSSAKPIAERYSDTVAGGWFGKEDRTIRNWRKDHGFPASPVTCQEVLDWCTQSDFAKRENIWPIKFPTS
jgi:hypothetical protein